MVRKDAGVLASYAIGHAVIDAACAAIVFNAAGAHSFDLQTILRYALLYNALAFAAQPAFGFFIDRWNVPRFASAVGCLLLCVGIILFPTFAWASVILAGVGNALFHLGGGSIVLNLEPGKTAPSGIYVAPGAIGLVAGTLLARQGIVGEVPFAIALLALAMLFLALPDVSTSRKQLPASDVSARPLVLGLLLFSIVVRSLVGLAVPFAWKSDLHLLALFVLATAGGKALGGIVADRFGWIRSTVLPLALSAPLLVAGVSDPASGIVGMLLFQMTMAVNLVAIFTLLPRRPAFAFGLTCLAIFIGAVPSFTPWKEVFSGPGMIAGLTLLSAVSLWTGLALLLRKKKPVGTRLFEALRRRITFSS